MRLSNRRVDKVILLGVFVGVVALFLPFFMVKEHRLAAGEPAFLAQASPAGLVIVIVLLAAIAYIATRVNSRADRSSRAFPGGVRPAIFSSPARTAVLPAVAVFVSAWLVVGIAGTRMLEVQEFARGRVSPSFGFWILLLSSFITITHGMNNSSGMKTKSLLPIGLALFVIVLFFSGILDDIAFIREYYTREDRFFSELRAHVGIAGGAVGAAVVVGIPLGVLAFRVKRLEKPLFALVNGMQTIPSLALFGLMIAPLALLSQQYPLLRSLGIRGVGNTPALLALFLYSLLPIVRNTHTSLSVLDPGVIDAGTGMGMTRHQLLWQVEFPIALPIILTGIRISAVQTIGNTTVAALIGAGGLGNFVFQGLGQAAPDLIVMGVIPIVILAVLTDRVFQLIVDNAVPGPDRRPTDYD